MIAIINGVLDFPLIVLSWVRSDTYFLWYFNINWICLWTLRPHELRPLQLRPLLNPLAPSGKDTSPVLKYVITSAPTTSAPTTSAPAVKPLRPFWNTWLTLILKNNNYIFVLFESRHYCPYNFGPYNFGPYKFGPLF